MNKLDLLVFAVHPDDAELSCSGTILKEISQGKKVGIVDFTQGELGTRGSGPLRLEEAALSSKILGLSARENLGFRDGFFENNEEHKLECVKKIRKYKPEIMFINSKSDRHPDHNRAHNLSLESIFLSGLRKIITTEDGHEQDAWRPKLVLSYIQDTYNSPEIVVDITKFYDKKLESIMAFKSQFYDPNSDEPESYISSNDFLNFLEGRARDMGHKIGVTYGEGFNTVRPVKVNSMFEIL